MTDPPDQPTPRLDAADRLERVIDAQSATLERIDDKSSKIARLLAILLGVVLSSLSLSAQLATGSIGSPSTPAKLTFLLGLGFLLLALAGAIVTLLNTRYNLGLGHGVGSLLSRGDYEVSAKTHLRRVLGTYAENVKRNYRIIAVNARRLRMALGSLLFGLLYLALSAVFVMTAIPGVVEWTLVVLSVPVVVGTGWFVASGKYLLLEEELLANE